MSPTVPDWLNNENYTIINMFIISEIVVQYNLIRPVFKSNCAVLHVQLVI